MVAVLVLGPVRVGGEEHDFTAIDPGRGIMFSRMQMKFPYVE